MRKIIKIYENSGMIMCSGRIFKALFMRLFITISKVVYYLSFNEYHLSSTIKRKNLFEYPKLITIHKGVTIGNNNYFYCENTNGALILEEFVIIGDNCHIDYSGFLKVGANTLLSENVTIYTHDHGLLPKSHPVFKEIIIGKNVWLGAHSIVLPNVKSIGDNSVIDAGSVVTKAVPPNVVVAGNPAKIIRQI